MHEYDYPRPALTADIALFHTSLSNLLSPKMNKDDVEVLLIKRKNEPYKHHLCLPGGFMDEHEPLEDTAKRELSEETNVYINKLYFVGLYDNPFRDNRGRIISVCYMGVLTEPQHPTGLDDAESANWYNLNEILGKNLGFDHKQMINDAWRTLECMKNQGVVAGKK